MLTALVCETLVQLTVPPSSLPSRTPIPRPNAPPCYRKFLVGRFRIFQNVLRSLSALAFRSRPRYSEDSANRANRLFICLKMVLEVEPHPDLWLLLLKLIIGQRQTSGKLIDKNTCPVFLTGHSLGGAVGNWVRELDVWAPSLTKVV